MKPRIRSSPARGDREQRVLGRRPLRHVGEDLLGGLRRVDEAGGQGHPAVGIGQLAVAAREQLGDRRAEALVVQQLLLEGVATDPEVAGRAGQQVLLEPRHVGLDLGDRRLLPLRERGLRLRVLRGGQAGRDHVAQERDQAPGLRDGDLGVDPRRSRQVLPGVGEDAGRLGQPRVHRAQALVGGRELPLHQREDPRRQDAGVGTGIALPGPKRVQVQLDRLHAADERRAIEATPGAQVPGLQAPCRLEEFAGALEALLDGLPRRGLEPRVIVMDAGVRGEGRALQRLQREPRIDDLVETPVGGGLGRLAHGGDIGREHARRGGLRPGRGRRGGRGRADAQAGGQRASDEHRGREAARLG